MAIWPVSSCAKTGARGEFRMRLLLLFIAWTKTNFFKLIYATCCTALLTSILLRLILFWITARQMWTFTQFWLQTKVVFDHFGHIFVVSGYNYERNAFSEYLVFYIMSKNLRILWLVVFDSKLSSKRKLSKYSWWERIRYSTLTAWCAGSEYK